MGYRLSIGQTIKMGKINFKVLDISSGKNKKIPSATISKSLSKNQENVCY